MIESKKEKEEVKIPQTDIMEKANAIAQSVGLPFVVRPLTQAEIKIPVTYIEIAGICLRKFGKLTALESGILASFRASVEIAITNQQRAIAELFLEMQSLLGVENLEELQELLVDADRLLELASQQDDVKKEKITSWMSRMTSVVGDFNSEALRMRMELDVVTFMIAMRGDDCAEWSYMDSYTQLTSNDIDSILEFVKAEEGIDAEENSEGEDEKKQ